jgi:hypothetical protein
MHAHAARSARHTPSNRFRHAAPEGPRLSTRRERDEAGEAVERMVDAGVPYFVAAAAVRTRFARRSSLRHG